MDKKRFQKQEKRYEEPNPKTATNNQWAKTTKDNDDRERRDGPGGD
ncbi:MAG: hypothetical protein GX346_08770 [Clostridiales bacterium]|nr:hypothetical protein [Clostridiales bacterium]